MSNFKIASTFLRVKHSGEAVSTDKEVVKDILFCIENLGAEVYILDYIFNFILSSLEASALKNPYNKLGSRSSRV